MGRAGLAPDVPLLVPVLIPVCGSSDEHLVEPSDSQRDVHWQRGGQRLHGRRDPDWHLRVERHRARIPCSERHRHGAGHRRDPVPRGPVSSASDGVRRHVLGVECPGSWDRRDRGRRSSPSDTPAPTGPGLAPSSAHRVKPAFLSRCSERPHRGSLRPALNTGRAPETCPGVPPGWRCSRWDSS